MYPGRKRNPGNQDGCVQFWGFGIMFFVLWLCNILILTLHYAQFSKGSTTELPYECRVYTFYNGVYTEYTPKNTNTSYWPARTSPDANPCCTNYRAINCVYPELMDPGTICCDYSKDYNLLWVAVFGMGLTCFIPVIMCTKIGWDFWRDEQEDKGTFPRVDCVGRIAFFIMYALVGIYIVVAFDMMFEDGSVLSMPESDYGIPWDGSFKKTNGGAYNSLFCMLITYLIWTIPAFFLELTGWNCGDDCGFPGCCPELEMWRLFQCEPCLILYACFQKCFQGSGKRSASGGASL